MKPERSVLAGSRGAGQPERFADSDRHELLCWSMGLNSRRRGQSLASAAQRPDPLAHAPRFGRAFGQQVLASPGGLAADPVGGIWVADTGHDRVAEFTPSGLLVTTIDQDLDHPAGVATDAAGHV
jgi:hypothetical protein